MQRAQCTAFESGEWLAEIQDTGVFFAHRLQLGDGDFSGL
ncbi:hypothetical protein PSYPI_47793, partial [Pseudomonas syringae pv. pisi str. 1704B]